MKSPKNKGNAGEREAIGLLTKWATEIGVFLDLERNLEQVRHGGSDINGVPGLDIEVKRVEQPALSSWWRQVCTAATRNNTTPFLMHRQNRKPWRFRVRAWVYPAGAAPLDVDMDLRAAEAWFKAYIVATKEE